MTRCFAILSLVALAAMVVGSVSAAPQVTGDLVFYYGFNSIDGTTVTDGSGNGHDGTITGSVTQTTGGPRGNAARFWNDALDAPGVDWNFITLPTIPNSELPIDAITVAAWYNVHETEFDIQSFFNTWSRNDVWATTCVINRGSEDTYRFTLRDYNWQNIAECRTDVDPTTGPYWDQWTHIAMTFTTSTPGTTDGKMCVYENGKLIGTADALNDSKLLNDWGDEDELTKGSTRVSTEGDNCRQIFGALDEVYVFGRALTAAEIGVLAAPRVAGDATGDGKVNLSDLSVLGSNWEQSGSSIGWDQGDFTDDETVNLSDLSVLGSNWGYGETTEGVGSVPEPSTLAMLFGAAVVVWLGRRRTR